MFLLHWFLTQSEKEEQDQQEAAAGVKKSRKKKKATSADHFKETLIQNLVSLLELDLARLWKLDKPEDAFMLLFLKSALTLLQNPANMSSKTSKESIFHLVITCLNSSSDSTITSAVSSVVDMIMKNESLTKHMVDLLVFLDQEKKNKLKLNFVDEIFREIGKLESSEFAQDANGAKLLGKFIAEISDAMPKVIMANMAVIMPHLDEESYVIRNAILHSFARVVATLVAEKSEAGIKTRDQLLVILKERFKDVNAYTRSHVIQCWSQLCEEKAIPLRELPIVIDNVIGRMIDKSAFVRRSALQFLIKVLEYNPYGTVLKRSVYEVQLKEAEERLAAAERAEKEAAPQQAQDETEQAQEQPLTETQREVLKMTQLVKFHKEAIKFIDQIHISIPVACQLLDSKTSSDVVECIQYLSRVYNFSIEVAIHGVKKMIKLVWSRESSVKDEAITAFDNIFFQNPPLSSTTSCLNASRNLIQMVASCTLAESGALEAIIAHMVKQKTFPEVIVMALWEIFGKTIQDVKETESVAAAVLLRMVATANPALVRKKLKTLIKHGLGERAWNNPSLAAYTCAVLEQLAKDLELPVQASVEPQKKKKSKKKDIVEEEETEESEPIVLDADHSLFKTLSDLLLNGTFDIGAWITLAEKAISCIFSICKRPDDVVNPLIAKLKIKSSGTKLDDGTVKVSTNDLVKLFFVLGHSALKELVFIENEFKLAKKLRDSSKKKESDQEKARALEDNLGLDPTSADDHEFEEAFQKKERAIMSSENSAYASFAPLVINMCTDAQVKNMLLKKIAILTLCKFMTVSNEFCEKNLQILFTLLTSPTSTSEVRTNIIVAVVDMAVRFPNTVEPWIHHIYSSLRDADRKVRKHTLMVLSHLILNDMVKVKSNIGDIARCIEDEDEQIVNLTKSFFEELSRKATASNNPIYNMLPEILSRLSSCTDLSGESFRNIMKYILAFITKDKQTESLVERLCQRFKVVSDDIDKWRDLSFCLSLLSMNDKCVKKVVENLSYYSHALIDDEVYQVMKQVAEKAKTGNEKKSKKESGKEYKQSLADWEKRVDEIHGKLQEDKSYLDHLRDGSQKEKRRLERLEAATTAPIDRSAVPAQLAELAAEEASPEKPKRKKGGRKPRQVQVFSDDENEPELLPVDEEEEEEQPKKRAPRKRTGGKRKRTDTDDDEEVPASKKKKTSKSSSRKPLRVSNSQAADDEEEQNEDEEEASTSTAPKTATRTRRKRATAPKTKRSKVVAEENDENLVAYDDE